MSYDRNPAFGKDQSFSEGARRVMDLLWETTGGDVTAFPKSYLENLRHEFSDGNLSMLEVIDRVDLGPNATYDDYCEVVDALLSVDYNEWPHPDDVLSVSTSDLLYEVDNWDDFSEFDFADEVIAEGIEMDGLGGDAVEEKVVEEEQTPDPLSEKMELFLKKVISSVYLDGVTSVTDMEGNPPTSANDYLMSPDGKSFSGIFYDSPPNEKAKKYTFTIMEDENGTWSIKY